MAYWPTDEARRRELLAEIYKLDKRRDKALTVLNEAMQKAKLGPVDGAFGSFWYERLIRHAAELRDALAPFDDGVRELPDPDHTARP